jgi:hypothetical protein
MHAHLLVESSGRMVGCGQIDLDKSLILDGIIFFFPGDGISRVLGFESCGRVPAFFGRG